MIVTRFAPSPTGNLHIGGLRTALFSYLFARRNGGKFLLRIEDTDLARNSHDATKAIIEAFNWVGLDYDGEAVYQSKRFPLYTEYINCLISEGKAYYCYMSKEELDSLREEQRARGETPKYDNRYRDFKGTPPAGIAPVVRIKAPLEGYIEFRDGIKGEMRIAAKELDDYIIARSDGTPTYNFVVSIDDALMGVTDVIRGDDHLSNTPKQIIIYQALGFKIPKFYHVPMILNPEGKKLSKRDGAMGVMDYKRAGYLPEAVLNFLVRLGWSHGDQEIFSLKEMLESFDPSDINSSASAYNAEKFLWLNHHYINQSSNERLEALLGELGIAPLNRHAREILYPALKERCKTLVEFGEVLSEIVHAPREYEAKLLDKVGNRESAELLESYANYLRALPFPDSPKEIEESTQRFLEECGAKSGKLFMAVRLALLGKGGGVGIFEVLIALGKEESVRRIDALIAILNK